MKYPNREHLVRLVLTALFLFSSSAFAQPPGACLVEDSEFATADGGCKDLATGLVFSLGGCMNNPTCFSREGALDYCATLDEGGFSDWRRVEKDEALDSCGRNDGNLNVDYIHSTMTATLKAKRFEQVVGFAACTSATVGSGSTAAVACVRGGGSGGGGCKGKNCS